MSKKQNYATVLDAVFAGAQLEAKAGATPVDEYRQGSEAFEEAAKLFGEAVTQYSGAVVLLQKKRLSKDTQAEAIRVETLQFIQARMEHAKSRREYWIDQARKLRAHE